MHHHVAGISTVDLFRVAWRRRGILLAAFLLGIGASAGTILWMPRTYVARAVLMIEPRLEPSPDGSGTVVPILPDSATVDSLAQLLASRSLAQDVVGRLALATDPELRPASPTGSAFASLLADGEAIEPAAGPPDTGAVLDRFLGHVEVARAGKSHVITVTYSSNDAVKSAAVANAIASSFVAERRATGEAAARRAAAGLEERLQALESQVTASTSALATARANAGATNESLARIDAQLAGLQHELIGASADRAGREAKLARIRREGPAAGDDGRGSALLENLEALRAQTLRREAENAAEYGERHPSLISVRAERAQLESRIAAERRAVIGQAADEVEAARARERSLADALGRLREQAEGSERARSDLRALEQRVELDRRLYEAQLARVKAADASEGSPDVRVISEATVPAAPEAPRTPVLLLAGIVGSTLLGFFAIFVVEQADDRLRTPADIRDRFGQPTLALLPEVTRPKVGHQSPHDWLREHPGSCEAEALRTILMGIDPRRQPDGARVVLVTSALPGEGKSTLTLALARTAVAEGLRVLLVDADLRRPRIAAMLGIEPGEGLAELAAEQVRTADVLLRDPHSALQVIPGSAHVGPPAGLLGDKGVPAVLQAARATYDLVLVDCAPLLPVADAARLALVADRVLLLVRWGHTRQAVVEQALLQLGVARERLAGIVLSRVDLRRHRSYATADAGVAYARYRSYYVT